MNKMYLEKTVGSKILYVNDSLILYIDKDGAPHIFAENIPEAAYSYKQNEQTVNFVLVDYFPPLSSKDDKKPKKVEVDVSEIKEKCVDLWCLFCDSKGFTYLNPFAKGSDLFFGFEGISGKKYWWYTGDDYDYIKEPYCHNGDKIKVICEEKYSEIKSFKDVGKVRFVLFKDGTLHSSDSTSIDMSDETEYDDRDIPDELFDTDVERIEAIYADNSDRAEALMVFDTDGEITLIKSKDNYYGDKEMLSAFIDAACSGEYKIVSCDSDRVWIVDKNNKLQYIYGRISRYNDDKALPMVSAARYMKSVADYTYGEDGAIIADAKGMIWLLCGDYKQMELEKIIPAEFLAESNKTHSNDCEIY